MSKAKNKVKIHKSPLRYPGGKNKVVQHLAKLLPEGISEYREPMVGGGSMFFLMRSLNLANSYWINDEYRSLIDFWLTCQHEADCDDLMKQCLWRHQQLETLQDRKNWFQSNKLFENSNSRFFRAQCFFLYNRMSFSGTTRAGGFSPSAALDRFTKSSIHRLEKMPELLKDVKITRGDYTPLITTPGNGVFIYLDPPYVTAKRLYGENGELHEFDHDLLASGLRTTTHQWMLSYDDCDKVRSLYGDWATIRTMDMVYGMINGKRAKELIITNY